MVVGYRAFVSNSSTNGEPLLKKPWVCPTLLGLGDPGHNTSSTISEQASSIRITEKCRNGSGVKEQKLNLFRLRK